MKTKSSTNSLIALCFLFVAVLSVGVILKDSSATISADTFDSSFQKNKNFLTLNEGENQFVAASEITMDSDIIGINGSLISLKEAKRRGIVESVYLFEGRKVLGEDLDRIESDQQFALSIVDISSYPTIYLGGIK